MPSDRDPVLAEVSVREFRENLSRYLRKAREGERFIVTSHGEAVAEFGPPVAVTKLPRPFGLLRGQIRMAPDFDETPEDLIAVMEGRPAGPST